MFDAWNRYSLVSKDFEHSTIRVLRIDRSLYLVAFVAAIALLALMATHARTVALPFFIPVVLAFRATMKQPVRRPKEDIEHLVKGYKSDAELEIGIGLLAECSRANERIALAKRAMLRWSLWALAASAVICYGILVFDHLRG